LDLSEIIRKIKLEEADSINECGLHEQIEFIIDYKGLENGLRFLEKLLNG